MMSARRSPAISAARSLVTALLAWTAGAAELSAGVEAQALSQAEARVRDAFGAYITRFNRTYRPGSKEFLERLENFRRSHAEVERQNSKPKRLWTAALNLHSDRTPAEFKAMTGWKGHSSGGRSAGSLLQGLRGARGPGGRLSDLPKEVSYLGLQTTKKDHIRNQGCGDCWAQSTAAMLEAHHELHRGRFRPFSAEEINQCTENFWHCGGDGHCEGATNELALQHALLNGLWQESDSGKCPTTMRPLDSHSGGIGSHEWLPGVRRAEKYFSGQPEQAGVSRAASSLLEPSAPSLSFGMYAWERLPENEMLPMMRALVEKGPIGVAVATDWKDYGSGIYDGCTSSLLGHAVLLIGYGQEQTEEHGSVKFWHLQNSWGEWWGDEGKFKLLRTDEDEQIVGLDSKPELGTACKGGPKQVQVKGPCGLLYDTTVPYFQSTH